MKNKAITIIEKGYRIDLSKIREGFLMEEIFCSAETINKAKYILLQKIEYIVIDNGGIDFTYLNIPVIRYKDADLIEVDGIQLRRHELASKIKDDARRKCLKEILEDSNIKYCFIRKRGTYYLPNSCGYTSYRLEAGVYTKQEAVSEALSCDEITLETINIADYNKLIADKILELSDRILTSQI